MTFLEHDVDQRSPEWQALRLGRVCGSRAHEMLATIKTGEAAARRNLRTQLVLERLTGRPQERNFQSQAMQDGIEREEAALALYEAVSGKILRRPGYVSHTELMAGASPDGVRGEWEFFVEVKAPIPATHLEYLKTGKVPDEYWKQMLHLSWLTTCEHGVFVSYQPDFPPDLQLKIVSVEFGPLKWIEHERAVKAFLAEVDQELATLKTISVAGAA